MFSAAYQARNVGQAELHYKDQSFVLMRSVFDYGCTAYMPAAESNLKKLDVL